MLRRMTEGLIGGAAVMIDRAATLAVEAGSRAGRGPRIAISHSARVAFLERLAQEYPTRAAVEHFAEPAPIKPVLRRVRSERGRTVYDAVWQSGYVPRAGGFAERYLTTRENHFAVARLFRASTPRPIAIIIHGYMAGTLPVEERLWPLETFDALGYDTALFVLPFHGRRANPARGLVPEFPGTDPRMTVEGFLHALWDLRAFMRWLSREGHPRLGVIGMSLGGYTAALAATLQADLSFLVPIIPLACLADFAREQGSLSAVPAERAREHALLETLYRPVSPLALPPRIAADRVLVVGARADRVTPITHARRLAVHFAAPLIAWKGGHLLQIGRRETFGRIFELLSRAREA